MRICIDLDGVIAELRTPGQDYRDVAAVPGAIAKLRALKAAGHTIILYTARNMKTRGGNVGAVVANVGLATLEWLAARDVPYDELYFGKPWADVYVDDNGHRFEGWDSIDGDGANLPLNRETAKAGKP